MTPAEHATRIRGELGWLKGDRLADALASVDALEAAEREAQDYLTEECRKVDALVHEVERLKAEQAGTTASQSSSEAASDFAPHAETVRRDMRRASLRERCEEQIHSGFVYCCESLGFEYIDVIELLDDLEAAEARVAALTEALTGALAELDAYVGIANPVGLVGRWMPIDGAQRIFARARAVLVEGAREKAYTGGTRS